MRSNRIFIATIGLIALVSSCNDKFFDQVPKDRITLDQVFSKRTYSEQFLANVYNYIQDESRVSYGDPWDNCSDDMDQSYDRAGAQYSTYKINLGNWSASSDYYNYWSSYYKGIMSATYFMNNIDNNEEMLQNNQLSRIAQYKAEARFLRAYFYYAILRQYGPCVLLGDDIIAGDLESDNPLMRLPRSPYDSCVAYIVKELDAAAEVLPTHFTSQLSTDYGRATAACCKAIKNRVLMLAASPQFNGNSNYTDVVNNDGTHLFSTTYDKNKWVLAAQSAKDIIDMGIFDLYKEYNAKGELDPYMSCRNVFLDTWNNEAIMYRTSNDYGNLNRHGNPRHYQGYESVGVTQQLVDEFEMANGLPITDENSGYSETGFSTSEYKDAVSGWVYAPIYTFNMYVNREPRFYVNVAFCGAYCQYNNQADKYRWNFGHNGEDGNSSWDHPRSGYCRIKAVDPAYCYSAGVTPSRAYLMIRYAEILLNYIEALNECDPGNSDILKYLNQIRNRAGLPNVASGLSQDAMREKIRHERRVELCGEHIRYFDTRRWLIAEQTDGGPFYGMNLDANVSFAANADPSFYTRTVFETRVFRKAYYLYPIPQSEINKDPNIVQNPGW